MIALAKKLHRYPVNGRRRTLAEVARALAEAGYLSSAGTPFTPSVSRMLLKGQTCERRQDPIELSSAPDEDVLVRAKR